MCVCVWIQTETFYLLISVCTHACLIPVASSGNKAKNERWRESSRADVRVFITQRRRRRRFAPLHRLTRFLLPLLIFIVASHSALLHFPSPGRVINLGSFPFLFIFASFHFSDEQNRERERGLFQDNACTWSSPLFLSIPSPNQSVILFSSVRWCDQLGMISLDVHTLGRHKST